MNSSGLEQAICHDNVGSNHGTPSGQISYEPGMVGQAIRFPDDGYIDIPSPVAGGLEIRTLVPEPGFGTLFLFGMASLWGLLRRPLGYQAINREPSSDACFGTRADLNCPQPVATDSAEAS